MLSLKKIYRNLFLILGFAMLTLGAHAKERAIQDLVTPCKEMEAKITVSQFDAKELEKIGKDFGAPYRLRNMRLFYRSPDQLRLEASSRLFGDALLILDGARRFYAVSKLNIRHVENLTKEPSKRQSLLEYGGQLSEGTLQFMEGTFLKEEKVGETAALVYALKYTGQSAMSYYHVWIDPTTKVTLKRVWFDGQGKLKATFLYSDVKEITAGIWMPSRCEMRNAEGAIGAILDFKEVKVGEKLSDSLFEIKP